MLDASVNITMWQSSKSPGIIIPLSGIPSGRIKGTPGWYRLVFKIYDAHDLLYTKRQRNDDANGRQKC